MTEIKPSESLKESKVATEEEALKAVKDLIAWTAEHDWKYEDCPTVYDCLIPLESFFTNIPKKEVTSFWKNFFTVD